MIPRWLVLSDVPVAAALLREAYGGARWRHIVKTLVVPHLIVPGSRLVLGVAPDRNQCGWLRRVQQSATQLAWLLSAGWRSDNRRDELPWVLRPSRTRRWRLMNLVRSAVDADAAKFTVSLGSYALRLADDRGIEVRARVDRDKPRLLHVYRRRGFEIVGGDDYHLFLSRAATTFGRSNYRTEVAWSNVLRTGRTTQERWQHRFGLHTGPLLDVGAGDSPLAAQLRDNQIPAVALDPQYALRPPEKPGGASIAGVAEALPFCDRVFATVNASYVLQHIQQTQLALLECLRVARADGVVVVHPVWRGSRRRNEMAKLPGVRIVAGRILPPRRQRPSLVILVSEFDAAASAETIATALRPSIPVRNAGRLAMRLVISVRRTNSVGPGAIG
jgi:SAM-dependent methyltransferase